MAPAARSLLELVEELPIDAQMEVRDFVEFLLAKHGRAPGKTLRQDYRNQFTSLELQEKSVEWRSE
jgi:hypothetical protein